MGDDKCTKVTKCDFCDNPAVCLGKAGLNISFVDAAGKSYDDPDRDVFACDECCGHGDEEGKCYSLAEFAARATAAEAERQKDLAYATQMHETVERLERRAAESDARDRIALAELQAERDRLAAEVERLSAEAAWVRRKLGLSRDTPACAGNGSTLYGTLHVVCSHAQGWNAYIKAGKCDDQPKRIAELTVEMAELRERFDSDGRALMRTSAEVARLREALDAARGVLDSISKLSDEPWAAGRARAALTGITAALAAPDAPPALPRGWRWVDRPADRREGPGWDLKTPTGVAATVFAHRDLRGHNWFVWDQNGVGGENSSEPTAEAAKAEAARTAIRWGKHPAGDVPVKSAPAPPRDTIDDEDCEYYCGPPRRPPARTEGRDG